MNQSILYNILLFSIAVHLKCRFLPTVVSFQTNTLRINHNNNNIFPRNSNTKRTTNKILPRTINYKQQPTSKTKLYKSFEQQQQQQSFLEKAVHQYVAYTSRLWNETSTEARHKIAGDKTSTAIKSLVHILQSEEMMNCSTTTLEGIETQYQLLDSCNRYLDVLEKEKEHNNNLDDVASSHKEIVEEKDIEKVPTTSAAIDESTQAQSLDKAQVSAVASSASPASVQKPKKPRRSILLGATMGSIVACWVFSGNYIFTALFTLMTMVGQLEYYRMVMNTGIYPARRISVTGACAMFITALFAPHLHQIVLPVWATFAMIWFCIMKRQISSIAEIATTFTGMFYLGYIPSFWVRIRLIGGGRDPTKLAPIAEPILKLFVSKMPNHWILSKSVHLPITTGAIFIFWSWLCIAFSDVGAYFSGRYFGKTKLNKISPTAGKTSPNKTVEGVIGGCAASAILATLGGWVQMWPYWYILGPVHGIMLGLLGFIGDLTASMLKRDAGLKDFGDLIPEHGGIMDRVDSFIFTAPYSWVFCRYLIPFLKKQVIAV